MSRRIGRRRGAAAVRRTGITLLTLFLLSGSLLISGCNGARRAADEALAAADGYIERYNAVDARVADLLEETGKTSEDASGALKGLALIEQAEKELRVGRDAVRAAKAQLTMILALDVDEDLKRYARMQIEIADLTMESDLKNEQLIGTMRELFELAAEDGLGEDDEIDRLIEAGDEADADLERLGMEIEKKHEAADEFFARSGLGGQ